MMLKTPEFKQIVVVERNAIKNYVPEKDLINYTTKLEVGILALLWCQGSQNAKANYLYKLANPQKQDFIGWSDDELKFVFVKLLEYATDLPLRYFEVFTPDNASN